jgi:hypothetical protein
LFDPALESAKVKRPPLRVSPENNMPPITTGVPTAERLPSYVLLMALVLRVRLAGVTSTVCMPLLKL